MKRNYLLAGLLLAVFGTFIVASCNGSPMESEPVSSLEKATNTNTSMTEESAKPTVNERQYVDLGLPSGTLWATENEKGWYSTQLANSRIGEKMPTAQQFKELINECRWDWEGDEYGGTGYTVIGHNGNSIFLPANGYMLDLLGEAEIYKEGIVGKYISSTKYGSSNSEKYMTLYFDGTMDIKTVSEELPRSEYSVRLVKNQK